MPREGAPRLVAVVLPHLPVQRVRRAHERHDDGSPLAVAADERILCCDAVAAAAGVSPGAPLAEALAACGRLQIVAEDAAADRAALQALAEALLGIAPGVELSPPDVLLLDASGARLLARRGTPEDVRRAPAADAPESVAIAEVALAERAIAIADGMGYAARAVVATGRGPARALARQLGRADARREGEVRWVAPDGAAGALAPLPLGALGLAPAAVARLAALGVRDAGALARLPAGTLAHRFGADGPAAARLARGEDPSPLVPYAPETLPQESLELEAPADTAEPLLFALKRIADRVAARLAGRGLGATRLGLVLKLDPRGEERLLVPLAQPTASAARWLVPMKEQLFALRLPGPVTALRLVAVEVASSPIEQLAFGDRPEAVAALETVLARLAARLGEGALFAAEPVERYLPEGAYRPVPFRPPAMGGRAACARAPEPRPTRLLAAPELVVAEGEGGRLTALRVGGCDRAVLAFEGPERLRGEWWSGAFDRDYYRVRLEGLGECWVFRDGADGRLYLHGFFD